MRAVLSKRPAGSKLMVVGVLPALGLVVVVAAPQLLDTYWLGEVTLTLVYVVATLGTDIVVGRTGLLSMCQASFFGIGAYVAAIGQAHEVNLVAQVALAIGLAAVAGVVVAVPTLKLSGLRLALVTLLFGMVLEWALDSNIQLTGGSSGMAVSAASVGGLTTASGIDVYGVSVAVAIAATVAVWQLTRGQFGRRLVTMRDAPLAATAVGISVMRGRVLVFILGAVLCSAGGLLYGYVEGFVSPSDFNLFPSVYLIVAVLLGGRGSLVGAWLGAGYVVLLPELFVILGLPNAYPLVGGVVLVVVTLVLPGGLASIPARVGSQLPGRRALPGPTRVQ